MPSSLPSIQRRLTLKWVCHFTLLYISLNILKFLPAVRNMLWTKEMPHVKISVSWIISVKKNGMHLTGILIRTRSVCSSWANFGSETPVEQKISRRRAISIGWLCVCFSGLNPPLPYHQQSVISWLGSSFLFDQIVIFRSIIKTSVVQFRARFYILLLTL